MNYKFLVQLIFISFFTVSCFKDNHPDTAICSSPHMKLRSCPKNTGNIFLPRTYTPNALYVGYSSDSNHYLFIQNLIEIMSESSYAPIINILVPREDIVSAHEKFKTYFSHKNNGNIRFYPSISAETMWMQDYFEILTNTKTGKPSFIDLPYLDREGEMIPMSLALTCKMGLIPEPDFSNAQVLPGNGDYGGNIEPFSENILAIGNNMTKELANSLSKVTTQEVITLNVEWLDTGHVDELFAMLPDSKNAHPCEQTIIYSSPAKAFELLKGIDIKITPRLPSFSYDEIQEDYPDYFECIGDMTTDKCKPFYEANIRYNQLIKENLDKIQSAFKKHHNCNVKELPSPQLFTPLKTKGEFGYADDRSVAFNQNSVNNIYFWPTLILPKQTIPSFHTYIDTALKKLPYRIHYSDADFVHTLLGGIHCATSVSYACAP